MKKCNGYCWTTGNFFSSNYYFFFMSISFPSLPFGNSISLASKTVASTTQLKYLIFSPCCAESNMLPEQSEQHRLFKNLMHVRSIFYKEKFSNIMKRVTASLWRTYSNFFIVLRFSYIHMVQNRLQVSMEHTCGFILHQ